MSVLIRMFGKTNAWAKGRNMHFPVLFDRSVSRGCFCEEYGLRVAAQRNPNRLFWIGLLEVYETRPTAPYETTVGSQRCSDPLIAGVYTDTRHVVVPSAPVPRGDA